LVVGIILNWSSCQLLLPVYYWTDCSSRDILFVLGERTRLSLM